MKTEQNRAEDSKVTVNKNEQGILAENFNYLYPNGHRMTNQMRWFKGSRYRYTRSDMAA